MGWAHGDFFKNLDREGLEQVAKAAKQSVVTTAAFADRFDLLQGRDELLKACNFQRLGKDAFERLLNESKSFEDLVWLAGHVGSARRRTAIEKAFPLCASTEQASKLFQFCSSGELNKRWAQLVLKLKGQETKPPP